MSELMSPLESQIGKVASQSLFSSVLGTQWAQGLSLGLPSQFHFVK